MPESRIPHWRRWTRRRVPAGAPPGTLIADPDAPRPVLHLLAYGPDAVVETPIAHPDEVVPHLGASPVVWVNVDGLGDTDVIRRLGEIFALHPLAIEDVINVPQRAKVEEYGDRLFVVTRMTLVEGGRLRTEQLSFFLGPGFVLSFQERAGDCLDPVRDRIRRGRGRIRDVGADYLAYAIIDAVIDNYFPVLDHYGERLEELEDAVVAEPDEALVGRIHEVKRDLLTVRRAVWPHREMLSTLVREPLPGVTDETRVYLRDCYDHAVQVIDLLENYREIASGLLDVYLSSVSNRMNQVMKVLTLIATIFIPLTFLAGVYGMNFDPDASPLNMPELGWYWGYPALLLVMLLLAGACVWFFRRKGWL